LKPNIIITHASTNHQTSPKRKNNTRRKSEINANILNKAQALSSISAVGNINHSN